MAWRRDVAWHLPVVEARREGEEEEEERREEGVHSEEEEEQPQEAGDEGAALLGEEAPPRIPGTNTRSRLRSIGVPGLTNQRTALANQRTA